MVFNANKERPASANRTAPIPDQVSPAERTIPVSQVRAMIRQIAVTGGFLKNQNGGWLFGDKTPFTGLNLHASYQSEDQAVDTVLGIYFPELVKAAA